MKSRLTYCHINDVIKEINKAVVSKYKILHQPKKSMSSVARNLYHRFIDEETKETKGKMRVYVCVCMSNESICVCVHVKWEYMCVCMSAVWSVTKSWETKLIPEDSSSREVVLNQGQFSHQRIFCHLWRQFWLFTPGVGGAPGTWWVETKGPTEVPYSAQGSSDKKGLSSIEYLV